MEVDASVLRTRTEAEFEKRRRQLQNSGGTGISNDPNSKPYRGSFSTPLDSKSTLVMRGKCVQWEQKPDQFKAFIPPGFEAERVQGQLVFESSKTDSFKDFDFNKLCSKVDHERGNAASECAEMFDAVRTLGTTALSKARFCGLSEPLPCVMPNMDDIAIRIVHPAHPLGDPETDFKVEAVKFEDCSLKIDFVSPENHPSVWSTIEITGIFPSPGTAVTSVATDGGRGN